MISTKIPSIALTYEPTKNPTVTPSEIPSVIPTTTVPTTVTPTLTPTLFPTAIPTVTPTSRTSIAPTRLPTAIPTFVPTRLPTASPTVSIDLIRHNLLSTIVKNISNSIDMNNQLALYSEYLSNKYYDGGCSDWTNLFVNALPVQLVSQLASKISYIIISPTNNDVLPSSNYSIIRTEREFYKKSIKTCNSTNIIRSMINKMVLYGTPSTTILNNISGLTSYTCYDSILQETNIWNIYSPTILCNNSKVGMIGMCVNCNIDKNTICNNMNSLDSNKILSPCNSTIQNNLKYTGLPILRLLSVETNPKELAPNIINITIPSNFITRTEIKVFVTLSNTGSINCGQRLYFSTNTGMMSITDIRSQNNQKNVDKSINYTTSLIFNNLLPNTEYEIFCFTTSVIDIIPVFVEKYNL